MRVPYPFAIFVISFAVLCMAAVNPARAAMMETNARHVILLDFETGSEMFVKQADELMEPASMTKMMTIYMLFRQLKNGTISLDDTFPVSEKAWRKGGSKMFVEVGNRVRVEDLIHGIVVQSGNDASIVVAEGLAGTEEAFAQRMTEVAHEIGMTNTTFKNASGWPDPEHMTTARDLATLVEHTIRDFPEYYHYYADTEFTYAGIPQPNRNPLLYRNIGVDGLKTGHTESAGYGLAASAERNGRRIVMVAAGFPSDSERAGGSELLIDWGFREFDTYALFEAGETVANARVWLGGADTVPLVVERPLRLTLHREARKNMKVTAVYDSPIPAPIEPGMQVGEVVVSAPDRQDTRMPLIAGGAVRKLGTMGRLTAAVNYLVFGQSSGE